MLAIAIRFTAGRYHATPWGRHVNEADVEWPPSPWRILRALVATWHRKLDPSVYPEALLERLVDVLSASSPVFRLPDAVHAHSRHYMPIREGRADKPVLVFDAFLRLSPDDPLIVAWPDTVLGDGETFLLDRLLADMGFLGRAESWVECRRLERWDVRQTNCRGGSQGVDHTTGESPEPVRVLLPMPADDYASWCGETLARLDLKAFPKAKRQAIHASLPARLIDALRLDTSEIQGAGWSRAPGSCDVLYQRPAGALAVRRRTVARRGEAGRVTTVRFALAGKPLPRVEDAVRIGELTRVALMHGAKRWLGEDQIPAVLSGHGLPPGNRHGHAFFLPEDADGDGRIDHITVHAVDGFPAETLQVFEQLNRLYEREGGEWRVVLEGVSRVGVYLDAGSVAGSALMGPGTHWESVTPYLHPWHRKKGEFGHTEQLRRECRNRGLPEPEMELLDAVPINGRARRPVHFYRFRSKRGLIQPDTRGALLRLKFSEPVKGPLAFGFGCHFGLGMFKPI